MLFRKIISFAVPKETQCHADLMAQASTVLKRAHKRGVELEYILEVSRSAAFLTRYNTDPQENVFNHTLCLFSAWS